MSIYAEYWNAAEARDWERFGTSLTDDVVGMWPQSREAVRGRDALVRFMAAYPGDWHIVVEAQHADETGGATRIATTLDGETMIGLTFFTQDRSGRIA